MIALRGFCQFVGSLDPAGTCLTLVVSVQGIEPRKRFLTALALIRLNVQVQIVVPFTIMHPSKAPAAPWPLALERTFVQVRTQMAP